MYICMKGLFISRSLPSPCGCFRCNEDKNHDDVISYYKNIYPQDAAHCEIFPEKISKNDMWAK